MNGLTGYLVNFELTQQYGKVLSSVTIKSFCSKPCDNSPTPYNSTIIAPSSLCMNRKKKISDIYQKKLKKAKAHLHPKTHKEKYVSKADREKLAALETVADAPISEVSE